jgi:hypothetical protein
LRSREEKYWHQKKKKTRKEKEERTRKEKEKHENTGAVTHGAGSGTRSNVGSPLC